ncbi:NitT/TauT family transport system substrate-binding protein [Bradyrhizobium sp. USDA 3240]
MNQPCRRNRLIGAVMIAAALAGSVTAASAQTKVRVGWCTSVLTLGVVPFAVAIKMGWYKELGIDLELVNLPGSSDCVRNVATGEVLVAVPTVEPVAILRLTGVKTEVFYTAFRRNIFGLAVPASSPITGYKDLKDKKIGVTSMASAGVVVARSVATSVGLDPDRDVKIVVSGQPAQSAVLLRRRDIDAVSQWDVQYTLMELAGVPMRPLADRELESFPSNSFVARPDTIKTKGDLLARLVRGYAMGTLYAVRNPRAAAEMYHAVYPQVVPTGLDAVQALDQTTALLKTVTPKMALEAGADKWGASSFEAYQAYLDWLVKAGVLKEHVDAHEVVTNTLIDQVNDGLDLKAVEAALSR